METISEVDLEIVHAVQVEPRASWATISATLEVSAATAARRWAALQDAGVAWTGATLAPGPSHLADESLNLLSNDHRKRSLSYLP